MDSEHTIPLLRRSKHAARARPTSVTENKHTLCCSSSANMRYTKGLQVVLLKPNRSEAYAEVEHDGHKYAIGEPGQPFEVQITIPQKVFISADKIFIDLYVEGQSPGYSYTLDNGHDSCTFKGFKSVLNGEQRYRQFEFAKPCKTAGHAIKSSVPEAGQLRVKFTHVIELGLRQPQSSSEQVAPSQTSAHVWEDKKWFVQPSLSVKPGMLTDTFTLYKVPRLTVSELAQCTLHMETATVLELRKVLQSSNPAHHTILRSAGLLPNEPLVPALSKPSVSAMGKPSLPTMREPGRPSGPPKLGVKRKVPFSDISSQTVVDLSGLMPRTYTATRRVERMDLTQT